MTNNIDAIELSHARPSHKALEPEQHRERRKDAPEHRMEDLANKVARRSSDRIRKNEEGKGVISKSDGH